MLQNVTVGMKESAGTNARVAPTTGDNVDLYANASVIGIV